jgi:hypothetical protein
MARKFLEGIAFGLGLGLVLLVMAYGAFSVLGTGGGWTVDLPADWQPRDGEITSRSVYYPDRSPLERLEQASVLMVIRHEDKPDGGKRAVVDQIHRRNPATVVGYKVGDDYSPY